MKKLNLLLSSLLIAGGVVFTSCVKEDNPTANNDFIVKDIPSDDEAGPNPVINPEDINTIIPNFNYTVNEEGGVSVIRLDMTGVRDPYTNDWVELYGTKHPKQNVWLSLDNKPKGFSITKVTNDKKSSVDLVFLVDNSGSMSEEANAIARDIKAWAAKLAQTIDIKFACVGYSVYGDINGGIDFTDADGLSDFLGENRGTNSTVGFKGDNAAALQTKANTFGYTDDECGVMALRFADETYAFRNGANRIYVNFTDEPNQPNNNPEFSTEWVKEVTNWPATKGTIHTVYSDYNTWTQTINYREYPWNLSEYTGGTTLFADTYFTNVSLDDLPVSGAMLNSYIIRFTNVAGVFDGKPHLVKITVKSQSPKGEILAEKIYELTFKK